MSCQQQFMQTVQAEQEIDDAYTDECMRRGESGDFSKFIFEYAVDLSRIAAQQYQGEAYEHETFTKKQAYHPICNANHTREINLRRSA